MISSTLLRKYPSVLAVTQTGSLSHGWILIYNISPNICLHGGARQPFEKTKAKRKEERVYKKEDVWVDDTYLMWIQSFWDNCFQYSLHWKIVITQLHAVNNSK